MSKATRERDIELLKVMFEEKDKEIEAYKREIKDLNDKLCAKASITTDEDVANALRVAIVGKANMLACMRNGEWNVSMDAFKSATVEEVALLVATYTLFKSYTGNQGIVKGVAEQ